ncbi:hypothetical protein HDU90_005627 [Geranomyces variabilis]|nr:hypothetical protein HDU90_005627 [Geranomyces variabilis]
MNPPAGRAAAATAFEAEKHQLQQDQKPTCAAAATEWPYVSPCGREINYVQVEDSPIVFHDLSPDGQYLTYAGTLKHPFSPEALYLSRTTGRLYHSLEGATSTVTGLALPPPLWMLDSAGAPTTEKSTGNDSNAPPPTLGLIKSSLLLSRLAEGMDVEGETFEWRGRAYPLRMVQ